MCELEQHSNTAAHWSAAQYHALFAADAQIRIALVAAEQAAEPLIQGFLVARCLANEWEIENIIVDEQFRRCGVGSSLVRELLAEARRTDVLSVILEVRESNYPALRLYESIGFKPEGRRKSYYQHPAEDAVQYRILLQTCDKIS
jgi:ribosomal-protein-alanine acetyltransferase